MTVEEAKQKLISWAESHIGYREGANNENKFADTDGIRKLYGWNVQNQPWCDIFVDAGFITCFGYDAGSAMTYQYAGCAGASCLQSANYYKTHNAFYDRPRLGDQIFFYSAGSINHTGLVVNVGMGAITTIEGNTSDSVQRRTYDMTDPKIAGYGRPLWELALKLTDPVEQEKPKEDSAPSSNTQNVSITVALPILRQGDKGQMVKLAQSMLESWGSTCGWYGCDGEFGPATTQAVRNFQITRGLGADGIIGVETWKALLTPNK